MRLLEGSGSKTGESRNIQRFTGNQRGERRVESVSRRRAAGQEDVHLDELVDGTHNPEELGHDDARDLLLRGGILNVSAIQNGLRADRVAHRWHIARYRAVAHSDQKLG